MKINISHKRKNFGNICFILLFNLFTVEAFSQLITFNNLYSDSNISLSFQSTTEVNSKLYSVGVVSTNPYIGIRGLFLVTDKSGNILLKKKLNLIDSGFYNFGFTDIIKGGDYFYISGTIYKPDFTQFRGYTIDPILAKYDTIGNLIWYKTYDFGSRYVLDLPNLTFVNGRINMVYNIVYDSQIIFDTRFRAAYLSIDTNGILQNSQSFNQVFSNRFEGFLDILLNNNNEMILTGFKSIDGSGASHDGYMVKVDSVGSIIWQKYYGQVGLKEHLNNSTYLKDGNILACGLKASSIDTNGFLNKTYTWLVKLDPFDGDTIWTKTVNSFYYSAGSKVFELKNGDLIIFDGEIEFNTPKQYAQFMRLDSQGNLLWTKRYDWYNDSIAVNTTTERIYDFIQTSDGGYLIVGDAVHNTPNFQQSAWLLKLDSNGCLVAGCGSVGIVEYEVFNTLTFKAYPNPAQDEVTISGELQDGDVITFFDFTGKLLEQRIINLSEIPTFDVSNYANGIYLLQLYRSGYKSATQKFVIAK